MQEGAIEDGEDSQEKIVFATTYSIWGASGTKEERVVELEEEERKGQPKLSLSFSLFMKNSFVHNIEIAHLIPPLTHSPRPCYYHHRTTVGSLLTFRGGD